MSKLFFYVRPARAYFGEKDFQQIAVVRAMTEDLQLPVTLCPCPIVREESGLAMSSRNTLLTPEERETAAAIHRTLRASLDYAKSHTVAETTDYVIAEINAIPALETEYYQIVDGRTLQPVSAWSDAAHVVGCITVYCGSRPVRLIDNITY